MIYVYSTIYRYMPFGGMLLSKESSNTTVCAYNGLTANPSVGVPAMHPAAERGKGFEPLTLVAMDLIPFGNI